MFFGEGGWAVKDLGSRNGTWVDSLRLEPGESASLGRGSTLQFGQVQARLASVDGPTLCTKAKRSGECRAAVGDLLSLPNDDHPIATIYETAPGSWALDVSGQIQALADEDSIEVGEEQYRVYVPSAEAARVYQTTLRMQKPIVLTDVKLRMAVSRDQEAIETSLVHGGERVDVPSRATHQLLLALARCRAQDQRANIDETECGWVYSDELARRLAHDRERINVDIHRLRQQFSKLGVLDATSLIERRPTTHQLRIGVRHLELS